MEYAWKNARWKNGALFLRFVPEPLTRNARKPLSNSYNSITNVCDFTYIWYIYSVYLLLEYYLL